MRKIAKRDGNHKSVVDAFRTLGCSVLDLGSVGGGCPDILVGVHGVNTLVEIKDGSRPPSARQLTSDQVEFMASWKGQVIVIISCDQVRMVYDRILDVANAAKKAAAIPNAHKGRPLWDK